MEEKEYTESIIPIVSDDFTRAFRDNADQSDIQYIADSLRKLGISDMVINELSIFMSENQHNWSKEIEKVDEWPKGK